MFSLREKPSNLILFFAYVFILNGCAVTEVAVNLAKGDKVQSNQEETTENIKTNGIENKLDSNFLKSPSKVSKNNLATSSNDEFKTTAKPHYKVGDPYEINGNWYYPERDLRYDKTGIASWYGDEWAGKLTANGEIFDPGLVSAAHKTLPMPSVVRVTNLENGKSLVVRLNDRGPYIAGRIIDLSREAAKRLGFVKKGIAKVRVQILAEQSLAMERDAKNNKFPLLISNDAMPPIKPDNIPEVSLDATTTRKIESMPANRTSAIELLSQSRIGEIIQIPVTETKIWVQIGAFYNKESALSVIKNYKKLRGSVSENLHDGKVIYRARLGPIETVNDADTILADVLAFGYEGAHIVVE